MDQIDSDLFTTWEAFQERSMWHEVIRKRPDEDNGVAEGALAELPEVSACDALRANAELAARLTAARWQAMRAAREEGASWAEIGKALGMSKQGAQDWYRRKIDNLELHGSKFGPNRYERNRSRAALVE